MTRHNDIHPRQRIELPPPRQRYNLPPAQRENPTQPAARELAIKEHYGEQTPHKEYPLTVGEWLILIGITAIMCLLICTGLAWLAGWPL